MDENGMVHVTSPFSSESEFFGSWMKGIGEEASNWLALLSGHQAERYLSA
jgi:hypothetical protein